MKSKFLYVVSVLLVVMASVFMYGCNEQKKFYDVSVDVLYPNYGFAYGGDTYEENTLCTIFATEKANSTFLAWMHNNVIVSYESTYSFEVTSQTRGTYTAIFSLPDMPLVSPTTILLDNQTTSSVTVDSINMVVSIGSSYSILYEVYNGELEQNNQFTITQPVLAFDKNKPIYCDVALTFVYETIVEDEMTQLQATASTSFAINLETLSSSEQSLNLPNIIQGTMTLSLDFVTFNVTPAEELPL